MKFALGQMQVARIEEVNIPSVTPEEFFVGLPAEASGRFASILGPHGLEAATGRLMTSVHSWLIDTGRHIVLIDTCIGNHKSRPGMHQADQLDTPFLARLAAAGVRPEQVDFVMCTHLHVDHVGWNTRLIDGRWVPTFPNARYVISRREFEHWDPKQGNAQGWGQAGVFEDSVLPCVEAGQVVLVDEGHALDDALLVQSSPGHTVGTISIRASSQGETGIFSGDCFHSPLQIAYPDACTVACEDPALAIRSRRAILDDCAAHGHLLMPAHFPPPYIGRVTGNGAGYRYHPGLQAP